MKSVCHVKSFSRQISGVNIDETRVRYRLRLTNVKSVTVSSTKCVFNLSNFSKWFKKINNLFLQKNCEQLFDCTKRRAHALIMHASIAHSLFSDLYRTQV